MARDFNEILVPWEKVGRIPKAISQMEAFGQVLLDCSLHDLGFCGPSFTWCNDRDEYNVVWE